MQNKLVLDNREYNVSDLSHDGQKIWGLMRFTNQMLYHLEAQRAVLTRARNCYIDDIKTEVIENKIGVNMSLLFQED